jgi:NAD dependent epimerase/dehydratase family enzyme
VSWIHIDDFCRAILFLIERDELDGIFNLAAPNPVTNAEFMRELRRAAGVHVGLPAARWMLEVGAIVLRTETELPLKSRWVIPTRLLRDGFRFDFPDWRSAAEQLCGP